MLEKYKIDFDDTKFKKELGEFSHKMPQVAKRMMAKVSQAVRKTSRSDYIKKNFKKGGTGNLRKLISYKTKKDYTTYISAKAKYASTQEKGATISAKNGKYLTFKIGEQWVKKESVTVPARPFLKPAINEYFSGSGAKAEAIMDAELQKQLQKFFEKGK